MATRVRELASVVSDEYDGDASRIWTEAADSTDLKKRIGALPGFGEMKVKSLSAVLAKQFGVAAAESSRPTTPRSATSRRPRSSSATRAGSATTRRRRKVPETPEAVLGSVRTAR